MSFNSIILRGESREKRARQWRDFCDLLNTSPTTVQTMTNRSNDKSFRILQQGKSSIIIVIKALTWSQAEQILREALVQSRANISNLILTGEALDETPNGAICLFGSRKRIQQLVNNTRFVGDGSECAALLVDNFVTNEDLIHDLSASFYKFLPKTPGEVMQHGLNRIFLASDAIIAGKDPDDDDYKYMYVILEKRGNSLMNYTLPGGRRKLGESSMDCAFRELDRLTGLDVIDARFHASVPMPESKLVIHVYHCFDDAARCEQPQPQSQQTSGEQE